MDLLWPEMGRKAASSNLRGALHAARKVLDPAMGRHYLASEGESLVLCPGTDLWVDVEAFEQAASTARRSQDPAVYRAVLGLYAGELLPEDRYEEWAQGRRQELGRLYVALIAELASLYEGRGEYALAIEALGKATSAEPTLEEAHASLMRLHALSGRPEKALTQYARLRDALQRGIGAQPAEAARRLRDEIAAGKLLPRPPSDAARPVPSDAAKHNLPAPMTSFVGREREIIDLKRALSMTRLLTLTGTGGTGKTRLAIEVARDLVGSYPDGVWMVELAPVTDSGLVAQEVAGTLGVQERPGEPLADTLVEVLAAKEMLLVLDNCEHLVEEAARMVDTLLVSCPRLRVLPTSREPLGVPGEVNWAVPPLSLPEATNGGSNVEAMMRYEAVRLFLDRARLRLPDFGLTKDNAQSVASVCRKLEGIPLAIELATARMGALAVEQVAQRLETSLDVLKGASRSADARQRTLRATLDWSHDLLSEEERTFFGRLSVFAGGWTLEAAEIVCSGDGIERDDVLDLLGGLVDKSLVVAVASTDGALRYRMLEPIRQYAREKLVVSGEADRVRSAHAAFFLAAAEEAEPELWGPEQAEWLARLEPEHDNMRAALSWALQRGKVELGLQLAGTLWQFWWIRGYHDEGTRWLGETLKKDGSESTARIMALVGIGLMTLERGEIDLAEAAAEESLALSSKAEIESSFLAAAWTILGDAARQRGELERATEIYEKALVLYREAGDFGDRHGIAWSVLSLGEVSSDRGDHERATQLLEEGLTLARELGSAQPYAFSLISLGYEYLLQGDHERAAELNERATEVLRERGHKSGLQHALDNLGWAALVRGDLEQAKNLHEESLALCRELGHRKVAAENLEGLACVAGANREAERAARLFGAARTLQEAIGYHQAPEPRALREPYLAAARSQLDEATWEAAFAKGRAMTFDEAVEYALPSEETDPSTSPASVAPSTGDEPLGSLTRREREVAALVARGLTNRQVAQELSISRRTAANHVAKILNRLGLSSRTQIGALVEADRPYPSPRD
jgi:predicted ATPase/DNA-binding SARP family transcriptional activator/DNA-binding CsgD family transcriptional regulator